MKSLLVTIALFLVTNISFAMDSEFACRNYVSDSLQSLCIELEVPAKIAKTCGDYSTTDEFEEECLRNHKKLSREDIIECARNSFSFDLALECIRS